MRIPALAIVLSIVAGCSSRTDTNDGQASALEAQCHGPDGPVVASPFNDPARCQMRPIVVDGQLTTNDPRAQWCEYGSCGRSGEATCRPLGDVTKAETFTECETGAVKCKRCGFRRVECGTTQGCLDHDACYDERYRNNEIDSVDLWMALRFYCDAPIAANYPASEWSEWMEGRPGPSGFQSWLPYQESLECQVTNGACE